MAYHRGEHAGAVAVSYSANVMPTPLSPSRRYFSGNTGTTTSGIGSSSTKLSSYRSSALSSFDRSNYYSSGSTSSSGYGSSHRSSLGSSFSSEYRRFCSPARSLSVSSASFSDTGSASGIGGVSGSNPGSRYSRDRSESRETLGSLATSAADIIAKYSPANYVPNIAASNERHSSSGLNGYATPASSSSTCGSNSKTYSSLRDSSGELSLSVQGRPPRANRRSPVSTLLNNHVDPDSAACTEVTTTRRSDANNNNQYESGDSSPSSSVARASVSATDDKAHTNRASEPKGIPACPPSPNSFSFADGVSVNSNWVSVCPPINPQPPCGDNNSNSSLTNTEILADNTNHNRDGPEDVEVPVVTDFCLEEEVTTVTRGHADSDSSSIARDAQSPVWKGAVSRPGGNHAGDNGAELPSTSRRGDTYAGNGSTSNGANGAGNNSQTATAHQNIYRGIVEQIEGSPTIRAPRSRLQTPRDERCGLNGLRNIGNTCFMNSVIQCLSNTRPLLEYLVNEQYLADINTTTSSMKGALIKAFSQVIQELWEVGGDHVVNTASLKSQIQRFAPRFMGYSQQDAQEFLRYLLEGLHEDVNRVTVKPQPIHTDIPEHYSDSQKAAESWKRYLRNEDSTIVDAFVGQLRSSLHCTSCGHVSVTLDPFWDLSLPIPTRSGTVKLNQCLEHFTREEILDGDEKPTCSKCQMRRKCTKSFSIQKFPKILVIHLKRFSPMERFRGKLNVLVDFPLTGLDLGAFSAPRVAGCTYNLYGIANHSGTTYSGHYTAYCKHPYSGEWHEYNDSRVSSIAARSVVSSEGYVLFYEQQSHSSNL